MKLILTASLIVITALFIGCGGGTSTTSIPAGTATSVAGVVVDNGPALTDAAVTLKDSLGATKTTTTASDGSYTIDVSSLTAPFVLTATGQNGASAVTLVSVEDVVTASTTNTINITPWTTAIAAALSSTGQAQGLDPVANKNTIVSSLTTVDGYIKTLLAPTLVEAGYTATQGPISTTFTADGTGYDSIYANLVVGTTPTNAEFMGDVNASPCAPAQITNCVAYGDPGTQTITNPNICGSDIASGAPIPCDAGLPLTSTPPAWPITIDPTYTFGCISCIFWGSATDFTFTPTQTPITLTGVTPLTGTGGGGGGGGTGNGDWYYHWNCNGDAECLATNPTGQPTGNTDEGPGTGGQSSCQSLLTFATNFWGSAAVDSCNQNPTVLLQRRHNSMN